MKIAYKSGGALFEGNNTLCKRPPISLVPPPQAIINLPYKEEDISVSQLPSHYESGKVEQLNQNKMIINDKNIIILPQKYTIIKLL